MPKKQPLLRSSPQKGCFQASQLSYKSLPGQSRFMSSTQRGELVDQRGRGEGGEMLRCFAIGSDWWWWGAKY